MPSTLRTEEPQTDQGHVAACGYCTVLVGTEACWTPSRILGKMSGIEDGPLTLTWGFQFRPFSAPLAYDGYI